MAKDYEHLTRAQLIAELKLRDAALLQDTEVALLKHDLDVHQEELLVQHAQLSEAQLQLEASRDAYADLYDFAPFAYLTLCPNGLVTAINLTGCSLLEIERGRIIGLPLYGFVAEPDRDQLLDHLRRCRQGEVPVTTELSFQSRRGKRTPVALLSRPDTKGGFRTVVHDLTERKQTEEEIKLLNASLEERVQQRTSELEEAIDLLRAEVAQRQAAEAALSDAHRRKDEFLAMLGHELRNPLAPIRNAAEVLRLSLAGDEAAQEMLAIVLRQTSHMGRIVDDLLDVSRILRGKIHLHPEPVDLVRLVREVATDFNRECESAGIALAADDGESPVWVHGDPTRLAQIVGNLLHNAIKFTPSGGRVDVTVSVSSHDPSHADLRVHDTGMGIDPDMLPRLFQTFSQADHSLDRSRGGLGLGLALVKGLAELHGGEVHAASSGRGKGAEFVVLLPLVEAPTIADQSPLASGGERTYRVLIIDDQRDTVRTMQALLKSLGHEVFTAADGEEGLRVAQEARPDVIFSDIGLPGMDGYAVARSVRDDPATSAAYLVAITGYGQHDDQRRAIEAGFNRHLTKPVAYGDLQTVLASLPKNSESRPLPL
jgi:PAS domain S-box-containing protein